MTDTDKIMAKCAVKTKRHDLTHPCANECSGYSQGVDDGAYGMNARLMPILRAILADRDRLRDALKMLELEVVSYAESGLIENFNCELGDVIEATQEALALSDLCTKEVVGEA